MKYRVHRINVKSYDMQEKLEQFINKLDGELISVVPHTTQYFMMYGAKIDYVLVIEKVR